MDRGAWQATVHRVTELDTVEGLDNSSRTALSGLPWAVHLRLQASQPTADRDRVKERRVVWGAGVSGGAQAALWGVLDVLVHPHCLCS